MESCNDVFDRYKLAEYDNIASAHFHTISAISAFFRYYLLVMAVPASVAGLVLSRDPAGLSSFLEDFRIPISIGLLVFAVIGLLVLLYVISLRLDVILYARAVNSIRRYFYGRSELPIEIVHGFRVLPQTRSHPGFLENWYFGPVVITFALFNSLYFAAGTFLLVQVPQSEAAGTSASWTLAFIYADILAVLLIGTFFVIHPLAYRTYARRYSRRHLRATSFGVDIDGVLNHHREHFCRLLKENTGKTLDPDAILRVPVSAGNNGISLDDELAVVLDPRFWTEMPVNVEAVEALRHARRNLGFRIEVVTHRPWPMSDRIPVQNWRKAAREYLKVANLPIWKKRRLEWNLTVSRASPLEIMTSAWLESHGIKYDALICEQRKTAPSFAEAGFLNRFIQAESGKYSFFVDDEVPNVNRLAPYCEYVFLIAHPYNAAEDFPTHPNVIRVQSWHELRYKLENLVGTL